MILLFNFLGLFVGGFWLAAHLAIDVFAAAVTPLRSFEFVSGWKH
jgi:hypothetical protein